MGRNNNEEDGGNFNRKDEKIFLWKMINLLASAFSTIAFALVVKGMTFVYEINSRLIKIETTYANQIDEAKLWQKITELDMRTTSNVPPKWFMDRVEKLDARVDFLEKEHRK